MKKSFLFVVALFAAAVMVNAEDYFLVGLNDDWSVKEANKLVLNEAAEEGIVEFMITQDLKIGDKFKVASSEDGVNVKTWFPDGMGNAYGEEAGSEIAKDAKYHIFFRPEGNGGDDWFHKLIFIQEVEDTAIDAVLGDTKSVKIMENGQMYIIRNGVRYNLNGAAVK